MARYSPPATILATLLAILSQAMPLGSEEVGVRPPQEEADLQLKMANELYAQDLHSLAADSYKKFFSLKASLIHAQRDEALYRFGECLIQMEKFNDAVNPFDQLIRNHSESRFFNNALFRRGTLRFLLNDPHMAIPDLENLLQRLQAEMQKAKAAGEAAAPPPLLLPATYYLGRSSKATDRLDKARPLLEEVEKDKTSNYRKEALFHLADLDFIRQKWDLAQAGYESFRAEYGDSEEIPFVNLRLGLAYRELGRFEKAIEALRRIPAGGPYSDLALYLEVACFFQSKAYPEVLKSFSKLEQAHSDNDPHRNSNDFASALYMVGAAHYELEHYKESIAAFQVFSKKFPKHPELESALWMTCMGSYYLQDSEGMVRSASLFLAHAPGSKYVHDVHYAYADGLFGLQKYGDSLSYFQKIPAENPFFQGATYRIALCYLKLAKEASDHSETRIEYEKKAAEAFDVFASKFQSDKGARRAVLRSAELNQGFKDFARAEQRYTDFLVSYEKEAAPEEIEHARFSLGQCQLAQGKLEAMAVSFAELLKRFPNTAHSAYAHYWIGRHYEDRKEWDRAVPFYENGAKDAKHELSDDAIRRLAMCFYEAKKFDAAAETLYTIYKSRPKVTLPDDVAVWVAEQFTTQKRLQDSIWVYDYLLKASPEGKWKEICVSRIHDQHFQLEDWQKTIEWGNLFLEKVSADAQKNEAVETVRFQTAYAYQQLKEYAKAEPLYHRLRQDGASPDILTRTELELGKLYHAQGEFEKALMDYLLRVGVLSRQYGAEAKYYAGLCLNELSKKSDIKKAIESLENLLKLWEGAGQRKGFIQDFPESPFAEKAKGMMPEIKQRLEEIRKQLVAP